MTDPGLAELRAGLRQLARHFRANTVQVRGVAYVVYPVVWCERCAADRPHHGPYCMSCGTDRTEATP
jgi:hypothetical protein